MKITLIDHTISPDKKVAMAAHLCYMKESIGEVYELANSNKEVERLINYLLEHKHLSPFEHITFTFLIENVSRALSHQLVRHRIASYSQQSQRHVRITPDQFKFVTPASITNSPQALELYNVLMNQIIDTYNKLTNLNIHCEDARFVLPNATCTNLIMTMNGRSLFNFFEQRACNTAQWEIREMAIEILKIVKNIAPLSFNKAGPLYISNGYCVNKSNSKFKSCKTYKIINSL